MRDALKATVATLRGVRAKTRENAERRTEFHVHRQTVFRELAELVRRTLMRKRLGDQ